MFEHYTLKGLEKIRFMPTFPFMCKNFFFITWWEACWIFKVMFQYSIFDIKTCLQFGLMHIQTVHHRSITNYNISHRAIQYAKLYFSRAGSQNLTECVYYKYLNQMLEICKEKGKGYILTILLPGKNLLFENLY